MMIVELFGPPGSGKTTFTHALVDRLRANGHAARPVLSQRPAEKSRSSPADCQRRSSDVGSLIERLRRPTREFLAIAGRPIANAHEIGIAGRLLQIFPVKGVHKLAKEGQYIVRLCHALRMAARTDAITVFDQGLVQEICSLALATGNTDESRLASALACVPQSDLAIRLEAPQETRVALTGIGIAVAGTAIVVSSLLPADRTITFAVGFAMVPVLALLRIRCSAIRGFGGVSWAIVPDRMVREGLLIGLICVASFGYGVAVGAPHVMTAMAIATAIGLACTVPALRHHAPEALAGEPSVTYESEAWRNVLLPLLIIGATEVLMNRTGVILLGWLGDTKGAGVYSLAFNIAMVVTLPKVALNTLFAPAISGHFATGDRPAMQALVTRTTVWTTAASVAIGVVLFCFARQLMGWFGRGYEERAAALRILLVGHMIASAAGSQLYVMTMSGYERGDSGELRRFEALPVRRASLGSDEAGYYAAGAMERPCTL